MPRGSWYGKSFILYVYCIGQDEFNDKKALAIYIDDPRHVLWLMSVLLSFMIFFCRLMFVNEEMVF